MNRSIHNLIILILVISSSCSSVEDEIINEIQEFTLTINAGDGGSVSASGGVYEEGSTVNVTATPNSEYIFQNWSNGSTDNPLTVTVNQNITLTANFIKRKYPLTINIQGEGTFREEIVSTGKSTPTEYNSGTTVLLTAVPNDGWEFSSWSGEVDSTTTTLTIKIDSPVTLELNFNENVFTIYRSNINHSDLMLDTDNYYSNSTLSGLIGSNLNGTVYINENNNEFLIFPGIASCVATNDDCGNLNSSSETSKLPSVVFKKINNKWVFYKYDINGSMYSARNSDVNGNKVLFSDGNEIGQNSNGPLVLAEINGMEINFRTITNLKDYSFYHDADIGGDLNNDGLYDIVSTLIKSPSIGLPDDVSTLGVFLQNENGDFELNNSVINYPLINNGENVLFNHPPFGIACEDLDGDNRAEIITYYPNFLKNSDNYNQINLNNNPISIFKYSEDSNKFEFIPNDYTMPFIPWSPVSIDIIDLNNDSVLDIIVSTENLSGGQIIDISEDPEINGYDIWIGKGNNKFEFKQRIKTVGIPRYFDINNDGFVDIINQVYPKSGGINLYENLSLTQNGAPCPSGQGDSDCFGWIQRTKEAGINLNQLIYINNGNGVFNQYQNDLILKGVVVDWFIPYFKNNKLHFVGLNIYREEGNEGFDITRELIYGYDIRDFEYTIYDIKINLL